MELNKQDQELLYACPSATYQEEVKQLSEVHQVGLLLQAKHTAVELRNKFLARTGTDYLKSLFYAHELAERALFLKSKPEHFEEVMDVLSLTTATLPSVTTTKTQEIGVSQNRMNAIGLASDMVKDYYNHYLKVKYGIKMSNILKRLFYALICVIIIGLVLFHPFFAGLLSTASSIRIFGITGLIIAGFILCNAGLTSAIVFFAIYCGAIIFLENHIPLSTLLKVVICSAPAIIGFTHLFKAFRLYRAYLKYQEAKRNSRRYLNSAKQGKAYFETCLAKVKEYNQYKISKRSTPLDKVEKYYQDIVKEHTLIIKTFSKS